MLPELSQCLQEIPHSATARAKAYEDRRYGTMSRKRNKGSTNIESNATFDRRTWFMKLLEAIRPPLPLNNLIKLSRDYSIIKCRNSSLQFLMLVGVRGLGI